MLVYSTDGGRMCPACRLSVARCACGKAEAAVGTRSGTGATPAPAGSNVRVSRETKGRNGKAVTLVRGLPLDDAALAALGKRLRAACGAGGTVKDGTIEVQGDHADRVLDLLLEAGWKAKRAGG